MQQDFFLKEKTVAMIETLLQSPLIKSTLAGSLSGTCSTLLFQPLDMLKTRIQSPKALGCNPGAINIAITVVRSEKLKGLWRGCVPSLTRTVPGVGVYFGSMNWLRTTFGSSDPSAWESVAIGGCARTVAGVTMLPFTVIKTRFESAQFQYKGMGNALATIYKGEGVKGLFSGMRATLLRDVPFSGLYLLMYDRSKKVVREYQLVSTPTAPMVHFSCGICSGFVAAVVTQPADVVKTHMQLDPSKYHSVRFVIHNIYAKDGVHGFFRGTVLRTMRRSMMAAFAWTFFEEMIKRVGLN
ncbi:hypothetical protein CAPTEDRAFT_165918 [Capitella teleta]|uniref:Mitochondrial glycine transporter n=1 Tax=Capitella teleta TaxID=283909 RepID=R7U7W5_CAPTE|nr:hypothetical protein CAPTEDRAFT_165918 [Capitella teleta]|eukprot:ELU02069.1 hypothetical protein CAPTEDRAFT_165918 [Capitella teleta]